MFKIVAICTRVYNRMCRSPVQRIAPDYFEGVPIARVAAKTELSDHKIARCDSRQLRPDGCRYGVKLAPLEGTGQADMEMKTIQDVRITELLEMRIFGRR